MRVRPFNSREKERNAELIVKMTGQTTILYRPNAEKTGNEAEDEKKFTFDHSYWSFDSADPEYATQKVSFISLLLYLPS